MVDAGPELLTHMADGLPTGKTWLRGGESLPSPSCTQGPCKSRSVRKISCTLDADVVSISYNRKVSLRHMACQDPLPESHACGTRVIGQHSCVLHCLHTWHVLVKTTCMAQQSCCQSSCGMVSRPAVRFLVIVTESIARDKSEPFCVHALLLNLLPLNSVAYFVVSS